MKNETFNWELDQRGEIRRTDLNSQLAAKYAPDNALDHPIVPYLVLLLCGTVDGAFFINLFQTISYDSLFMIVIQVAGFLFAFDTIPIYLGMQHRRIADGLSRERTVLIFGLVAFALASAANVVLRLMTMDLIAPDAAATMVTDFSGLQVQDSGGEVTSAAIALTVLGVVMPFLTSLGSYYISYLCYKPLEVLCCRFEGLCNEKRDAERRVRAILAEYSLAEEQHIAERLRTDDARKFAAMLDYQRALVLSHAEYVRERFREHLANPASISALTEEGSLRILEQLDRELAEFRGEIEAEKAGHPGWPPAAGPSTCEMDGPGIITLSINNTTAI